MIQFEQEVEMKQKRQKEKIEFEVKNSESSETMKKSRKRFAIRKLDWMKEFLTDIKESVSREVKKIIRTQ